jgi:NAD(P)-dependent dehydrogenase (short-subunit alcohol dehydrogenase family)
MTAPPQPTPPTERPLAGRTALVTGSSRNLGAAIAAALARDGARVIITYRERADQADVVRRALAPAAAGEHVVAPAELGTAAGAEALADHVLDQVDAVHVLVNNTGPFEIVPLHKLTTARFDEVWHANLGAPRTLAARFAPGMKRSGRGRIVNISAGSAYVRNHSAYTLAKAALEVLTEQLALELGPTITVNAVAPGQIAESANEINEVDPTFVDRAIAATPLGRLVTRGEVADLVATLCTPPFDAVTGATIPIDGGWRLPRF